METRRITEDQWLEFFDAFSRDHAGWPATVDVLDEVRGPLHLVCDLPLQGISFDTKGTRPSSIEISAGDEQGHYVRHVIDLPLNIRAAREDNGDVDVQIEPARGPVTLLHLKRPVQ